MSSLFISNLADTISGMKREPPGDDRIGAVALLAEPNRRALYDLVVASGEAVGRDDAVTALGISRELAAFHLDRLVGGGLLQAEYRRLSGRTGPGAGRPAKLYRRADREVEISLPPRHYERAADLMATALSRLGGAAGADAVAGVAREQGTAVGLDARDKAATDRGGLRSLAGLVDVLRGAGYEPRIDSDGTLCLRNCPYRALAAAHRDLTCGMNLAWAEGVVDGLGDTGVSVDLAPEPGRCCVVFHTGSGQPDKMAAPEAGGTT
jgi:predicted ArsR family transcriptional regulator